MRWFLVLCVMLAACGRPLSIPEADLATRMFGPSLDTARVRVFANGFVGMTARDYAIRPRSTCRERILPPATGPTETGRTAGVVLGNRINVRPDLFRADFARRADGGMSLGAAMFLVHELTHVWQWQNRAQTGYSPLRVGAEHRPGVDPYLFDPDANPRFLDYGYEQQASLVEEYLCCAALDPAGARTGRLRALLAQDLAPGALAPVAVFVPWNGVETGGICS